MMLTEDFIEGIREYGEDDWVQFADIGHLLIKDTGSNDNLIQRGVDTAIELMRRGILIPGDLTREGFTPWNTPMEESIDRIKEKGIVLTQEQRIFNPGDICWFQTDTHEM